MSAASGFRHSMDLLARRAGRRLEVTLGGPERTRVIVVLACVLALSSADTATVGASATQLRAALHISNTDIGLLVAVTSLAAAMATLPFGVLADRFRRTRTLGIAVGVWGVAMIWSATAANFAQLLLARLFLGVVIAAAGPAVASLIGDYFLSAERGRIYSYVLTGELLGAGIGFAVTGDLAALSWRAAFVILAVPAFVLAAYVLQLPEPKRGGGEPLPGAASAIVAASSHYGPLLADGRVNAETVAQRLARVRGVVPDPDMLVEPDLTSMGLLAATRYILRIRTNVILIVASACGYFYTSGMQTFGTEFVKQQYGINQAVATLVLLILGVGAVVGVLVAGRLGDWLLHGHHLNGRIIVTAAAASATTLLFIPALLTRSLVTAVPYLVFAAFTLSAQNPPIDAARLDIVPGMLWGRAEAVRTALRTVAQSLAPLLFGVISDDVFGGGRSGLQWTFVVMLAPLAANAVYLWRAMGTYPRDVATAAAAEARDRGAGQPTKLP